MPRRSGRYPSGQRGQTVNLLAYAFGGSNPPLPTIVATGLSTGRSAGGLSAIGVAPTRPVTIAAADREAPTRPANRRAIRGGAAFRGNSSAVERQPSKLGVAGSNPVSRSRHESISRAHVAQLAERVLGKDEVTSSILVIGSNLRSARVD